MNAKEFKALILDWKVAVLIILVILSVIAIGPHLDSNGNLATNFQYGLDLQQGAWLQLDLRGEVVGFTTDRPLQEFISDLSQKLETDVIYIYEKHLEIRKYYSQVDLERVFNASGGRVTSYNIGVSKNTADLVKRILENKLNTLGTKDAKINTLSGMNNIARYVRVELAGIDMKQAQDLVGKQGRFEIRIQTLWNETEHVIFGDSITSVGSAAKELQTGTWYVPFTLSESGASVLRDAAIKYRATVEPTKHNLNMILDNKTVFSGPLSGRLPSEIQAAPVRSMQASTGGGDYGLNEAKSLEIHLRAGALPVDVSIAGSGGVSAPMGERYKFMVILAGIFALLTVGLVIYFRYREPGIVLPMVLINTSEVVILLGFIAMIRVQMDLPTIAGLIAVLGTGIDQLVVITDEILHEGKVPSPNLYLKRLSRALAIIVTAAATVFIAMVPLALMDLSTLKGFAIITILGVLVGVIVTRPAYGKVIMQILSK